MRNRYAERFLELLAKGAWPADHSARPANQTVIHQHQGFKGYVVAGAFAAGVMATVIVGALVPAFSGARLVTAQDGALLDALNSSGVDIHHLSRADFQARLQFSEADGRSLVQLGRILTRGMADRFVAWLRSMPSALAERALADLIALAQIEQESGAKRTLVAIILHMDERKASAIAAAGGYEEILDRLAALSLQERQSIVRAGFPIVPRDDAKAAAIASINSDGFPADMLAAIAMLRRANPDRLAMVRAYLGSPAPLPACAPTTCTPAPAAACYLASHSCPSGFYPTIDTVKCAAIPAGMSMAK